MHGFIACNKRAEDFLFEYSKTQGDSNILRTGFGLTYYATREQFVPVLQQALFIVDYASI